MNKNSSTKDLNLSNNERLAFESSSIFKPKKYIDIKPKGFRVYVLNAGFKKRLNDLLIIVFDKIINVSSLYSKTSTPSAPIIWDKLNNNGNVKALIVNAGNANAHTGKKGLKIIDKYVKHLCEFIGCKKNEVLVSSTGVIGEIFDPNCIINQINKINLKKSNTILEAAKTIMTTDTYPKISIKNVKIKKEKFKIYGFAKGSGMIQPNMGTMLAYIFIEPKISQVSLKNLLKKNVDYTFNSISVDSDTSTSDTICLFSTEANEYYCKSKRDLKILSSSLFELMQDLSLKVIKDGEGITKLTKIEVINSKTNKQAKNIAFSIANSPLVKTAISGEDANWGRVIMSIGKTEEKINQDKIKVYFGKNLVCKNGSIYNKINLSKINNYMKNKIIEIKVDLKIGNKSHIVYGNDLSNDYIKINADYRS